MKSSDQKSFVQTLENVMRFYDKVLDEFTISAFWEILKQYDIQDIQSAFLRYMGQKEFAPKPASIKKILDAPIEEKARWAWDIAFKALMLGDESLLNNDPITIKIITESGGWQKWVSDFRTFVRIPMRYHFIRRYEEYTRSKENPYPSENYREEYDQFLKSHEPPPLPPPTRIESLPINPKIKELLAQLKIELRSNSSVKDEAQF
ncbi:MAG: hypothetical protein JSS07_03860 [Proteobacteria bacterium]|nr:hypothetical protein [Pseudomonadota bacterium]